MNKNWSHTITQIILLVNNSQHERSVVSLQNDLFLSSTVIIYIFIADEEVLRDLLDDQANGHLFNDDSQEPEVNKTNKRPPSTKTEKQKAKKEKSK